MTECTNTLSAPLLVFYIYSCSTGRHAVISAQDDGMLPSPTAARLVHQPLRVLTVSSRKTDLFSEFRAKSLPRCCQPRRHWPAKRESRLHHALIAGCSSSAGQMGFKPNEPWWCLCVYPAFSRPIWNQSCILVQCSGVVRRDLPNTMGGTIV